MIIGVSFPEDMLNSYGWVEDVWRLLYWGLIAVVGFVWRWRGVGGVEEESVARVVSL